MTHAWEESPGVVSSLRINVFIAVGIGVVEVVCGLVGFFLKLPDAITIIATGTALISSALGWKAFQAQSENRLLAGKT